MIPNGPRGHGKTLATIRAALMSARCPVHFTPAVGADTDGIHFECACYLKLGKPLTDVSALLKEHQATAYGEVRTPELEPFFKPRPPSVKRMMNQTYGLTETERADRGLPCNKHGRRIHPHGNLLMHDDDESICE